MNTDYLHPLTPTVFSILLALADQELHGTAITKQVKDNSNDYLSLSPSTLYDSLKQMTEDELIVQTKTRGRNKYYKIAPLGKQFLGFELSRYSKAIATAKKKNLVIERP